MSDSSQPSETGDRARTVGVIGLGAIGGHVARHLSHAGLDVPGYDVRDEAFTEFPEARRVTTVRELAAMSQTVLVAVYDDHQLREVLTGSDGILSAEPVPDTVCVLSTVTLGTLRWASEQAEEHGVSLIDCGVTGGSGLRRGLKIVVLAGGSPHAVASARPVLEAFADPLLHVGPLGTGMQAKLARNLMHYSGWYAAWEAARVAEACGIDIDTLVQAHEISNERSSGGGTSLLTRGIRPGSDPSGTLPARESSASFARKDLGYVLELADELGIALPGAELVRERIDLVVGLAQEDELAAPQ